MHEFREGDRVSIELTPSGWPRWDGLHDRGSSGMYAKGEVTVANANQFSVGFAPSDGDAEQAEWVFYQPSVAQSVYRAGSGAPELLWRPCTCGAKNEDAPCDTIDSCEPAVA